MRQARLISLIITLILFASAEVAPPLDLHVKNVTGIHVQGEGEVATQPGHTFAEKRGDDVVYFPTDHLLQQGIEHFAGLMTCRFDHSPTDCNEDGLATDKALYDSADYFREVVNCRFQSDSAVCADNKHLENALITFSKYIDAAIPSAFSELPSKSARTVTTTGAFTSTETFLDSIQTFTNYLGSVVTSREEHFSTATSTGALTSTEYFGKRADEMQQDVKTMDGHRLAPVNTDTSTTALAAIPSSGVSPSPSATSVLLTKRSIPAAITQSPQTPSATAVPTRSAVSSMNTARKGAVAGALGEALPNNITNTLANNINMEVQDSMDRGEQDLGTEDDDSKKVGDENEKRILPTAPLLDLILGDDLLAGGLAPVEYNPSDGDDLFYRGLVPEEFNPADVAMDPVLGDDLLSGGLVPEKPNAGGRGMRRRRRLGR